MQHTNVSVAKVYYVNILASAIRHSDMPRSGMQQRERAKYCPTERVDNKQSRNRTTIT